MIPVEKIDADRLQDVIIAVYLKKVSIKSTPYAFGVPSRRVRVALDDLEGINKICNENHQAELIENSERKQVYRWATKYVQETSNQKDNFTDYKLQQCLKSNMTRHIKLKYAMEEYGLIH